ncbi:MAG TPA: NlpC/P60 family protein [Bacillales bacterium]|nr:NlpC/P60 family protein [Bacillales bacterium]
MWKSKASIYQIGVSTIMAGMVLLYPSAIDLADSSTVSATPLKAVHFSVSTSAAEVASDHLVSVDVPLNVSLHKFNQIHNQNDALQKAIVQVSDPIISPAAKTLVTHNQTDDQSGKEIGSSVKAEAKPNTESKDSTKTSNQNVQAESSNSTASTDSKEEKQTKVPAPSKEEQVPAPKKVQPKKTQPKQEQPKKETEKTNTKTTVQSNTNTASTHTSSSTNVIDIAKSLIGTPYKWGGSTPSGFDCSGFIDYVYAKVGINLPHSANALWYGAGSKVGSPQVGDLIFFTHTYNTTNTATHVGIYIGGGRFIHAESSGVRISSLSGEGGYWQSHYLGAKSLN